MVTLEFLIAACLDPVQAALVLALVVIYRGPLPTTVAGGASALIAETVMALAAPGYAWGELIAPRLVAALLQAVAAVVVVWAVRQAARRARAALGFTRPAADGDPATVPATLPAALEASHAAPSGLALWHMRAYARTRIYGLHEKKNAALDCESR
jgi:hypothetical protein